MKRHNKLAEYSLSSLLLCLILTGCSGDSSETTSDETPSLSSYSVASSSSEDSSDSDSIENGDSNEIEDNEKEREEQDENKEESNDSDDNDDENEESNGNTNSPVITLPIFYKADAGRLLGSQCAQCHGTNGVSVNEWDSIAGKSDLADEIFEDDEPIMSAQAHGYTSEEVTLIGNWLRTLSKNDD